DPAINRGERLTANQILERGAAKIDKTMSSEPGIQAQLQVVIASVYAALGDYPRARTLLERAVSIESTQTGIAQDHAHALRLLAWVAARQGEYRYALRRGSEAMAILDMSDESLEERANVLSIMGSAHDNLGNQADAKAAFEQALAISSKQG